MNEAHTMLGINKEQLNKDISLFPQVHPITPGMTITKSGVSRLVMMDRYTFKDTKKVTLGVGDFVIATVKHDPKFPSRGLGYVTSINREQNTVKVMVEEEYHSNLVGGELETGIIERSIDDVEKPLEVFWEQIAKRNARGLAEVESSEEDRKKWFKIFYKRLKDMDFVPAGRVLYGAGSDTDVTFFNCYVMPCPQDSRGGISKHREQVMEIMSRGGGVGTNGSTLRPRHALARGVNGKSSGAVSWLDDIAKLTHLVEQGGSRRGAQMIQLNVNHPDIIEFIISKMQNPKILRFLIENTQDKEIKEMAQNKLKFTPLTTEEKEMYEHVLEHKNNFSNKLVEKAQEKLSSGGVYDVNNTEFLSGANISVCLTKEFMKAVDENGEFGLKFPDVESYNKEEMKHYNENWHEVADVREWEKLGNQVKTYRNIRAKELWDLINICATYSAEPGIFFIDNANEMTNASAYGQNVVATNPCGEQPLAPFSVCNLAAVNLANMVNKDLKEIDFDKLRETVEIGVRMQDNVISATPYFLEENRKQALGERRTGMGVMGLADMLIYCEEAYGSKRGNELVDKVFETIATTAYKTSVELAKERGAFPFLVGESEKETNELRNKFINSGYMKKMPEAIRKSILEHGIRNSHLLTVAPTGSTGTMVNTSTGLEPHFALTYFRSGRLGKFIEVKADIVQEYLDKNPDADEDKLPEWFITAMEMTPEAHADTQCIIQRWVDSSLSKTVNAPKGFSVKEVQEVYERLYRGGAKGGTVYVDGSRDAQVLTLTNEENDLDSNEFKLEVIKEKHIEKVREESEDNVGVDVGQTCPICRKGKVEEIGGCSTCTNCQTQLKCGV